MGPGVSMERGRGFRRDDERCLVNPSSPEFTPISSATTTALSSHLLTSVLKNVRQVPQGE